MTALHNHVRATEKTNSEDSAQTSPESIALAELASFIEESKLDSILHQSLTLFSMGGGGIMAPL